MTAQYTAYKVCCVAFMLSILGGLPQLFWHTCVISCCNFTFIIFSQSYNITKSNLRYIARGHFWNFIPRLVVIHSKKQFVFFWVFFAVLFKFLSHNIKFTLIFFPTVPRKKGCTWLSGRKLCDLFPRLNAWFYKFLLFFYQNSLNIMYYYHFTVSIQYTSRCKLLMFFNCITLPYKGV